MPNSEQKHDVRRQQLIEATMACIREYGLDGTTIAKVTQEAGLSNGIVNFYFKTKQELLSETLRSIHTEYHTKIDAIFSNQKDARDSLLEIVNHHLSPEICTSDKVAVWSAFSSARAYRTEYQSICEQDESEFQAGLNRLFEEMIKNNELQGFDSNSLARGFEGLLDNIWLEFLYTPTMFDFSEAKTTCINYLNSLFPPLAEPQNLKRDNDVSNLETCNLLAPWTYQEQDMLDLEIETLFKPNWQLAGHQSDIPEHLNYLTFDGLGERIVIIRGEDNEIRAFHNVCRHRGAKIFDNEKGKCNAMFSCPFHGWTYDTKGCLVAVPSLKTFEPFELDDNGLVPVEIEAWNGFIFIRIIPGGQSIADTLAPVAEMVKPYQLENLEPIPGSSYQDLRPYNWKVIHDIDNEGYHVPVGHPSLQQLYGRGYKDDMIDGVSVSYGPLNKKPARNWSVRHYQNLLPRYDHLPEENQKLWWYFGIFPNMVVGLYPDSIEFYMTIPVSVDKTIYRGAQYALPDSRREAKACQYLNQRINSETEKEDESFVRWMQDGLNSSALPDIKLSSIEMGVQRFHTRIQEAIPVSKLKNVPLNNGIKQTNLNMLMG